MIDEKNNNYIPQVSKEDFEFVHDNSFGKIKDQKFETKATTFAKDALKRFCKNKSSVVGAIIIGFLMLMSIFYPLFSPYDTTATQDLHCYLLPSKLFDAGTGWWDGCQTKYAVLSFDGNDYVPAGTEYNKLSAIKSEYTYHEVEYYDYSGANFIGGSLRVIARDTLETAVSGKTSFWLDNGVAFKASPTDNTKASIVFNDVDNIAEAKLGEYRISVCTSGSAKVDPTKFYQVTDWSSDYKTDENDPLVIDISKTLSDNGVDKETYVRLRFEVKYQSNYLSYILIDSINFTSDNEDNAEDLANRSIVDANYTCCLTSDTTGFWRSTGAMYMYQAKYSKVSYTYDMYEHQLGLYEDFAVGKSDIESYIEKGWCEMDWDGLNNDTANPNKYFKILNEEKCPIVNVDDVAITAYSKTNYQGKDVITFTCNVQLYRYIGYDSMPRYIFGSDSSGRDIFTHAFRCLKNSLLVSIICCAVCITIGLIWGSISGYYGGKTDLIMERITDILSGIPSTVLLTLMLLILGRTTVTFAFAVCLTGWIGTSSLTRTQFYRFKNREYVLASRTLGASDKRLIFKHILPNALGTIVTSSVLSIPGFIFTEASLAFLHLGLDSGDSFGVILSSNQVYLSTFPALVLFPATILCLLMISFNLFGNGLRDALNPTLKGGEQ